jgi:hypothetical protein
MKRLIIISGGQTGVDRAALGAAIECGVSYGGWCPQGGWAEDMIKPPGVLAAYPRLRATPSRDPAERTEWNVRDSDASLILTDRRRVALSPGTALAERLAARDRKPVMAIDMDAADAVARAGRWLQALLAAHRSNAPFRLAIGGPRESEAPGIYESAKPFVVALLRHVSRVL